MGTYLLPWSGKLDERSRLHTFYKIYGTVTGRLSGEMQQVPRDPFIRSVIGAPPGWQWIQADYSQIELRVAAHIAQEERMIRAFLLGEDIHTLTAARMSGRSVDEFKGGSFELKELRKKAKAVNFGFLYGMYPAKFQAYAFENYDVRVSKEEAELVRKQYFETYPGLVAWHHRQERLVRARGYVQSPLGRVRHLPDIHSQDGGVQREAIRQAINSPVQATASDCMLFGMVQLDRVLDERECFMVGTLHDGIFFECREDKVDKWAPIIKETLQELPLKKAFGADLSVPLICDVEWGQHWGEPDHELKG
jgi:DNA polymerase-1